MRILHVISSLDPRSGGPTTALLGLVVAQKQAGLRPCILATYRAGKAFRIPASLEEASIPVTLLGPCSISPVFSFTRLRREVERHVIDSDVVHIHGLWEEVLHLAAVEAHKCSIPYIIRSCGMLDPWSLSQSRWKKYLYLAWRLRRNLRRADALHFTTVRERDLTRPLALSTPSIIMPNGIDAAEFDAMPPSGTFHERHPNLQGKPYVLFLGRLHPKKGVDILIKALSKARIPDIRVVLAGPCEETYRSKLETLARECGVIASLSFTGMLEGGEKLAALRDAALFVLPSHQENFGNAVLEAMAAGVPVLVSDQVNLCDEVTRSQSGEVLPLDAGRWAEAMISWMRDPDRRTAAGLCGQRAARQRYDWGLIASAWREEYQKLITPRRADD